MTTTLTSNEGEERLTRPYKEHLRETLKTTDDYIGYLNACHEEGPETFALAVRDVTEFAATAMRTACVEKVKTIHQERLRDLRSLTEKGEVEQEDAEYERAVLFVLSNVIDSLKSLPLNQVRPEGDG